MTFDAVRFAPGWPGASARWTSAAKTGIGTAVSRESRVWFTLSHGIINEIYYPRVDRACTRDLGFIVTSEGGYFSDEARDTHSETSPVAPGIPSYRIRNTARDGRYRIEKEVLTDPWRDVVLQRVRFVPIVGSLADYHLHVLLTPHVANRGTNNTAWSGDYKGTPMLFAERMEHALALACSTAFGARSVGFVGESDGRQQLRADGRLLETFSRAENGNVAMTAEIDLAAGDTRVLAVGFGPTAMEAGQHALISLLEDFDLTDEEYVRGWNAWHGRLRGGVPPASRSRVFRISAAVLRSHESKRVEGGIIASLSIPWGAAAVGDDLGGYHLVWPRDLVQIAGGFVAIGAFEHVRRALRYLRVTQEADGHWSQNMWLDGTPYWQAVQMDETALPILLVDLAARNGVIEDADRMQWWPMIRRAAIFIARRGPASDQDRWEEAPGYAPFSVAAQVAALLVAAEFADAASEAAAATYFRETADAWNANLERWLYVRDTPLARAHDVDGYYVRIAGFRGANADPQSTIVGVDALALVRFGLRSATDPRVLNTIRVIDATLKVDTPSGTAWRRYQGDRYGEHPDGSPYDGDGIGRAWPLLTGERAHYELSAERRDAAEQLAHAMETLAGSSGLLPEQVWDAADIPERELRRGQASGSARPLAWAHAEYLKLCRSLHDGGVFDRPPQTVERYITNRVTSDRVTWRFNHRIDAIPLHRTLRIEVLAPAIVHWTADEWRTVHDVKTHDTTLGIHVVDLPTSSLPRGTKVTFTFRWPLADRWEGTDFFITID